MYRSQIAGVLILALTIASCGPTEWTASERAAVELACVQASATATGRTFSDVAQSELPQLCSRLAGGLEGEGCSAEEATDIVIALSMVSGEAATAMKGEC